MIKFLSIVSAICLFVSVAFAQVIVGPTNSIAWNPIVDLNSISVVAYDVAITQTNVTAASLGTTNTVASGLGILNSVRVNGVSNSFVSLSTLVPPTTPFGNYNIFARGICATDLTGTNFVATLWSTNFVVQWLRIPAAPVNLHIQ